MAKKVLAKLWVADFPTKEAREDFFAEVYDQDGNSTCPMRDDLGIPWFDHDFQEVITDAWPEYVRAISLSPIPESWGLTNANTALLLYQEEQPIVACSGKVLKYLGEFTVRV
jgi:hypothetical protein